MSRIILYAILTSQYKDNLGHKSIKWYKVVVVVVVQAVTEIGQLISLSSVVKSREKQELLFLENSR